MATTDSNSSSNNSNATPPKAESWKLPAGIEDHIESGLIKTAAGVAVGGAVGMILFRTRNWRAASAAVGAGVAFGSTYERIAANTTADNQ